MTDQKKKKIKKIKKKKKKKKNKKIKKIRQFSREIKVEFFGQKMKISNSVELGDMSFGLM